MSDIKIVELSSGGKEYLAVSGIPEDARNPDIDNDPPAMLTYQLNYAQFGDIRHGHFIPEGKWQILGLANDLSEEQKFAISKQRGDFATWLYAYYHILFNPLILKEQ